MNDFAAFLDETGISEEVVASVSQDTSRHIFLTDHYDVSVRESSIHGLGIFADKSISADTMIMPSRFDGKKTIAGRFTNHSGTPNSVMRADGDNIQLWATKEILCGTEITINYRGSVSVVNQIHREQIMALEGAMLQMQDDIVDLEVSHSFAYKTYCRTLRVPAGVRLIGKIHRYSCTNIISQGRFLVITDEGDYEIVAPYEFVSGAGVKKAMKALEDSTWTTVHPWDGPEDLDAIERALIVPSYEDFDREQREQLK